MPMRSRQTSATQQRPSLCYCPAAVRELAAARDELIKARTQLQQHDPFWNAIDELRTSREELARARDLLQRVTQAPAQEGRVAQLLERIEAAMPAVERIERVFRDLEEAHLIYGR